LRTIKPTQKIGRFVANVVGLAVVWSLVSLPIPSGADVRFVDETQGPFLAHVEIYGHIAHSDAEKLPILIDLVKERSSARELGEGRVIALLDSVGGDVYAAMRIGKMLRAHNAMVWVNGECSSACIFVLAGGVQRLMIEGKLGLHRPYFDQAQFANLSAADAKKLYTEMTEQCRDYLAQMGIRGTLFDEMLRIPSHKVRYISRHAAEEFNLLGDDPAYAEWRRARELMKPGRTPPAGVREEDDPWADVPAWESVLEELEKDGLSAEELEAARNAYWEEAIMPLIPTKDLEAARRAFDEDTLIATYRWLTATYSRQLSTQIKRYQKYPLVAQRRGWEGTAEVLLKIAADGRVIEIALGKSSGHEVLDREALEMVRRASPLPQAPQQLRGRELTVTVPIVFRLQDNAELEEIVPSPTDPPL